MRWEWKCIKYIFMDKMRSALKCKVKQHIYLHILNPCEFCLSAKDDRQWSAPGGVVRALRWRELLVFSYWTFPRQAVNTFTQIQATNCTADCLVVKNVFLQNEKLWKHFLEFFGFQMQAQVTKKIVFWYISSANWFLPYSWFQVFYHSCLVCTSD